MTLRTPKNNCLNCGTVLDEVSQVAEHGEQRHAPRPNENEFWFSVCVKCGHLMVVTPDLRLRNPTDDELIQIAGDRRLVAINKFRKQYFP
jgi:hypothetical protein